MGACLATPRDDAADAFEAPALDWKRLDAVERRADPTPSFAVASELKLRMAAAAKEARSGRFRYNGGVVDGTDAGLVELAISRVKIDDTRAVTAALDANDPLLVTLFHRRGEDRNPDGEAEEEASGKTNNRASVAARWVTIGVAECFPDGTKNGELLTHFRERARRELSRHKAPVFALPSDLRFREGTKDKTLRVVLSSLKKKHASRDGDEPETGSHSGSHSGSPESTSPRRSFDDAEDADSMRETGFAHTIGVFCVVERTSRGRALGRPRVGPRVRTGLGFVPVARRVFFFERGQNDPQRLVLRPLAETQIRRQREHRCLVPGELASGAFAEVRQELAVLRAVGEALRDADGHPTRGDARAVVRFSTRLLLCFSIRVPILPAPVEQRHEQRVVRIQRRGHRARVVDLNAADRELDQTRVRAVDHASVVPEPTASRLLRRGSHAELELGSHRERRRGVCAPLDRIETFPVERRRLERVRRVVARRRQARAHPTLDGTRVSESVTVVSTYIFSLDQKIASLYPSSSADRPSLSRHEKPVVSLSSPASRGRVRTYPPAQNTSPFVVAMTKCVSSPVNFSCTNVDSAMALSFPTTL